MLISCRGHPKTCAHAGKVLRTPVAHEGCSSGQGEAIHVGEWFSSHGATKSRMHLNGGTLASLWALPEGSSVCFKVLATNRSTRPASRASPQRSVPTALPLPLHSAEPTPGITVRSGGHSRGPPGARGSRPSPISPVGGTMSFEDSIRHRKRGAPMRLHGGKQTACALLTTPGGTAEGKWSLLTPMIVVHRKPGSPFSAAAFDKTTAWSGAGTALGIIPASRWRRPRPGTWE